MKNVESNRPGRLRMPRSRGAVTGLILVILGAWGALIPFVGPHFNFAYTPDRAWAWTAARGWLEVLPGAITVVGGLLLIVSGNRASAMVGGWLATLAGAWFVVGGAVAPVLHLGSVGDPVAGTDRKRAALEIAYFSGLGALIVFLGGAVLARLAVRLARDVYPLAPAESAEPAAHPAGEPYYSGLEEPPREVSPDAETRPQVGTASPAKKPRRSFRRQRETAAAGWPHPQA
ncbi:hypothetical protein A5791_08685 [Mycobacterium sp. 852002-51163_SCH5372311]|uniref:hypothetical protein n=1 Tax=Mycobacterium sp. 852002-51163_SCH5372311 TaxID=1834097 RepID=UPI0007FEDC6D|nr:hypothetical protein [Mycobacterium sp. 852002-51163_SCH5372311]OBF80203.1 hypothetical protein A5791_08685 [Mycobacterium sp. 852002-51163_SCH5372311]